MAAKKKSNRRQRVTPYNIWDEKDTDALLNSVIDRSNEYPGSFELPSPSIYYETIKKMNTLLDKFNVRSLRQKMRNIKVIYVKALMYKRKLTGDDNYVNGEFAMYVTASCPLFERLHYLFQKIKDDSHLCFLNKTVYVVNMPPIVYSPERFRPRTFEEVQADIETA